MNTPCPDRMESIDLAAAGWLPAADEAALRAHAGGCAGCRAELAAVTGLAADLRRSAPAPLAPAHQPGRRTFIGLFAAAAALLLAFALTRPPQAKPRALPSSPTWLAYHRALAEPDGLDTLLDHHAAAIRLGTPEPVLMARLSFRNPEELP